MTHLTPAVQPAPDSGCAEWDCDNLADPAAPVGLCQPHLRLAFAYVLGQIETRSAEAVDTIPALPKHRRTNTHGWIYFIAKDNLIKIGWSSYPKRRFNELQPDSVLLVRAGTLTDERQLHAAFAHLRDHGEWFRPEAELLTFIKDLRRASA